MSIAVSNAHELLDLSLDAEDQESLYDAITERYGITSDQAEVIGSFQFKRLTKVERTRLSAALDAAKNQPQ